MNDLEPVVARAPVEVEQGHLVDDQLLADVLFVRVCLQSGTRRCAVERALPDLLHERIRRLIGLCCELAIDRHDDASVDLVVRLDRQVCVDLDAGGDRERERRNGQSTTRHVGSMLCALERDYCFAVDGSTPASCRIACTNCGSGRAPTNAPCSFTTVRGTP